MQVDEFEVLARLPVPLEKAALTIVDLALAAKKVDPDPSEAQKETGNYRKGHVSWKGLGLTIETAKGQYRRGVSRDGVAWSTLMKDHYGYIKNTESEADGDHVDIFLCEDDLDSDVVFVVNQMNPDDGTFDEHKCILGVSNKEKADEVYHRNYDDGWQGCGAITPITVDNFKWWLEFGDTSKPIEDGMFAKNRRQPKQKAAADLPEAKLKEHVTYDPICPHCNEVMYERHFVPDREGPGYRHRGDCYDLGPFNIPWPNKTEPSDFFGKQADLLPSTSLRPHQQAIAATGEEPEARKLLYHALGSGKSLSSLAAAETAGEPYTAITPASLRPNYRKEQEKFTDQTLDSNLASYNAVARGTVPPTPTMIFDEAQRMRNPESLTTQNAIGLARKAKHVYLNSATPIVNHPHDLTPLIEILTGKHFDPEEFDAKFIDERKISPGFFGFLQGVKPTTVPTMKNQGEFRKLLDGKVDYYAPEKPDVETKEEQYVDEMSPEQARLYRGFWDQLPWLMRWKLKHDFPLEREELTRLSSFLSGPRQVSLSTLPFMKGKADPYRAFEQSPKLQRAVKLMTESLKDPETKGVAFSNFIDAGLSPYGAALDKAGIPYGMFHGGLNDAARKRVVDDYNAGKIRALLLGPSGGEGISLKGTRLLQLLDPHWNTARSEQAAGRGIRYDSHLHLPLEDRNVRVQRFTSRLPSTVWQRLWRTVLRKKEDDPRKFEPGVDTYLENLAKRKDELNQQFLDELRALGTKPQLLGFKQAADESRPFTIAVDLDGTLAEIIEPHDDTKIGEPRRNAAKWMKAFKLGKARLIIFTVRGDKELVKAWLDKHEMPFDYINENPDQPEGTSGKVIADVYWDDRAVNAKNLDEGAKKIQRLMKAASADYCYLDPFTVLELLAA